MWDRTDARNAVNKAEEEGRVADSMDVRGELLARMKRGEITVAQMQAELRSIKRNAKGNGLVTRNQAFNGR